VNLLLTGRPGVGKTTVIERVVASLPKGSVTGFFTRELRERGVRYGFTIEALDGPSAVLASVRFPAGPRVGRYRVDVEALDGVAVPAIALRGGVRLVVLDEIGKMECLSRRFCDAVREALDTSTPVLATIAQAGGGFIAEVRRRRDMTLLELTSANRDAMPGRIVALLRDAGPPR
jgi:nucleoside-triphosphatase